MARNRNIDLKQYEILLKVKVMNLTKEVIFDVSIFQRNNTFSFLFTTRFRNYLFLKVVS